MVSLRAGDFLRLHSASGTVIWCRAGMLWITQEKDTRDIVLRPGACFSLDRSGLALISSLGDGEEPAVLQLLGPQRVAHEPQANANVKLRVAPPALSRSR